MDTREKDILLKKTMMVTRASYQPLPVGNLNAATSSDPDSLYPAGQIHFNTDALDINEVYPNLFISDEITARKKKYLVYIGVTHVMNTAEGHLSGYVSTSSNFYQGTGISYKGIGLGDLVAADASKYFKEVSSFIDSGLKSGGKVLVHCKMGLSRSATMVLAFLMLKRDMSAIEAMTTVRQKRNIHPNDGFIRQLAKLDNKLERKKRSVHPENSLKLTVLY